MKRTIKALFLILTVGLFATSCTETARNEIAVQGTWELYKIEYSDRGKVFNTDYESNHYYIFNDNYEFIEKEAVGTDYEAIYTGKWHVDEDVLILTLAKKTKKYLIDKASLFTMTLSQENFIMDDGKSCTRILYFRTTSSDKTENL